MTTPDVLRLRGLDAPDILRLAGPDTPDLIRLATIAGPRGPSGLIGPGAVIVSEYGATAGGTFQSGPDATTGFQAAADALVALGGGVFIIPPGAWRCTQPVKLRGNNIAVVGFGDGSIVLMDETPSNITASTPGGGWSSASVTAGVGEFRNTGLFQCWAGNTGTGNGQWASSAAYSHLQFRDFRILGNSASPAFDNYQSAGIDYSNNSTDCVVDNVTFQNLRGFGAHARGNGERHTVTGCRAVNVGNSLANHGTAHSVFADNTLTNCEGVELSGAAGAITGNTLSTCFGIAIGGNPAAVETGTVVANNSVTDATIGIYIGTGMSDAIIANNTIMRTVSFGINVGPGASSGPNHVAPIRTQIIGNVLRDIGTLAGTGGTRHAIFVSDTTDVKIVGNDINTHTSATYYSDSGIAVTNHSDRAVIRGNTIDVRTTPTPGWGLYLSDSADLTVEDNQYYGGAYVTSGTVTYRAFRGLSGATSARPVLANGVAYTSPYLDTTINKPVWGTGTSGATTWRDAAGSTA